MKIFSATSGVTSPFNPTLRILAPLDSSLNDRNFIMSKSRHLDGHSKTIKFQNNNQEGFIVHQNRYQISN